MTSSLIVAGIDVSKTKLDVYIHPLGHYKAFDNTSQGFEMLFIFFSNIMSKKWD